MRGFAVRPNWHYRARLRESNSHETANGPRVAVINKACLRQLIIFLCKQGQAWLEVTSVIDSQ